MYTFDEEWKAKREALLQSGWSYPNDFEITALSTELHKTYADVEDPSSDPQSADICIAGRVMFRNRMGRSIFLRLQDRGEPVIVGTDEAGEPVIKGGLIQVYARRETVGEDEFALLKSIDIGDFLWVRGYVMRTRTGELTVQVHGWSVDHEDERYRQPTVRLASKTLCPFPDRWNSVTDVQTRSRQRYVDLFMNEETRATFRKRSKIIRMIRDFFEAREFLEVETPMMHPIPGGATATPFITHHNALDMDLYLRIAPELYLKRLLVGGFERVFEINRSFRNEGLSIKHNPEFTMLEFYQAWATYEDLMELTEELIASLAQEVTGSLTVEFGDFTLDFTPPFRRAAYDELLSEATGLSLEQLQDVAAMESYWRAKHKVGEDTNLPSTRGKWWEFLFDQEVESTLVNPTFVTGFPTEISPLARRNDDDPTRVDRFELIVATWEIANAFSELNDPVDQAGRFEDQVKAREAGDEESMFFDADYIRALSYGMPPAAGEGIGIDRLTMLLTGKTSIRDVVLFPTLREEQKSG